MLEGAVRSFNAWISITGIKFGDGHSPIEPRSDRCEAADPVRRAVSEPQRHAYRGTTRPCATDRQHGPEAAAARIRRSAVRSHGAGNEADPAGQRPLPARHRGAEAVARG